MYKTLFTSALLSVSLVLLSQSFNKEKLDTYFSTLEKNNKFSGSVAITQDNKLIYTRSIGYSDIENKILNSDKTKYRIGSISKTFTAVLILKSFEEGKLKPDDKLSLFFPHIKNADQITISQLLQHRSGIHNITDDNSYMDYYQEPQSEAKLVDIITKAGSDFQPDSKYSYSNSGYILLTYILEKVNKKSYAELLKEKITKPLGLNSTYVGKKINSQNNEAYSYSPGNKKSAETDMSIPIGAGAVVSNPTDIVKFSNALFNGKLLNKESLEKMITIRDGYGYGLFTTQFNDLKGFGHSGGIDDFSSLFVYYNVGNVSFALDSNVSDGYGNNLIAKALLSAVYNKPYDIPEFKTYQADVNDFAKYIGTYTSPTFPLKIAITTDNTSLKAQATGQSEFTLTPTDKNKFEFSQAGIKMEFYPDKKQFRLLQNGLDILFTKE
ncbi:beta-lactamase family protein [Elizabethkingia anophelis]|uniref:serine hydrolase domain-containing protein n=1 Tax=Elizabethkingia anophelis TaxID=1117645 RepID=UPI00038A0FBF|nr:serine hydrolase domain-containing protein [Elizabethkingia anophelis]EQB93603.1 peptidase [Elizabethkingia anophelis 502]MCT3921987.1 beta-lactamase family protein [Elizabethkingia anophelis]MCT3957922.1 beta-lactamase family protein [Elizabethkingia anophelis]MCT4060924.1 beta-lactamase family protein [Elizabethkingia anophelis]MCT4107216.1 beta-lactamase family protein [Elizabethkingia anophelis]